MDNLPVGPAGITTQIVTIHQTFIYELMIEPYQVTGNHAETATDAEAVPDNLALVEQMLATFTFVDNDTLVGNATPTP